MNGRHACKSGRSLLCKVSVTAIRFSLKSRTGWQTRHYRFVNRRFAWSTCNFDERESEREADCYAITCVWPPASLNSNEQAQTKQFAHSIANESAIEATDADSTHLQRVPKATRRRYGLSAFTNSAMDPILKPLHILINYFHETHSNSTFLAYCARSPCPT
jgi:hypothetical protein